VQAVEQLGVEKAIPSRILEIMGVKCLTRHNIASHLQKYRSQPAPRRARGRGRQLAAAAQGGRCAPVACRTSPGPGNFSGWGPFGAPAVPAVPGGAPTGYAAGLPAAGHVPGRPVMGLPPPGVVQGMPHMGPPPCPGLQLARCPWASPTPWGTPLVPAIRQCPCKCGGTPRSIMRTHTCGTRPGAVVPHAPPAWFGPDGSVWHYPTVRPHPQQWLPLLRLVPRGIASIVQASMHASLGGGGRCSVVWV